MNGTIGVRLPEDLVKEIDEIANKERNPRSAVIRRLIVLGLEKIKNSGGG